MNKLLLLVMAVVLVGCVSTDGNAVGFKARYAECTKDWIKLDPDRKGGGDLLNLANDNFRDQNKFRAFLREIKAGHAKGARLVLLIRPSGVNNYYLARKLAEGQGLTPGHLPLPREDMKIPIRAEHIIPVPRNPAPGLKEYGFICRHGRILPDEHVDKTWSDWLGEYERWVKANVAEFVARAVRFNLQANQVIRNQLTDEWKKANPALDGPILKSKFLQIDATDFPLRTAVLKWPNKEVGDTAREIFAPNSSFRKKMEELADGGGHFITFYVFADSFEVCLAARKITDDLELEAGWKPFPEDASLFYGGGAAAQAD